MEDKNISTTYNPKEFEERLYNVWQEKNTLLQKLIRVKNLIQ